MKKFLLIIPALFILGSLSLAQEFSITSYNNTIDIQDQNSINETISFTVMNTDKTIIINWDRSSLNETFSILVEYESLSPPNYLFTYVLGFSGGFVVFFVVGFFAGNRIKAYRKRELIKTVLSEDENTIFKAVEKEGEILQNKLHEMTGCSKT